MGLNKNLSSLFLIILIQGCTAHYPVNEQLATVDFDSSLRFTSAAEHAGGRSDELTVGLAFSGGGTRASEPLPCPMGYWKHCGTITLI